MQWIARLSRVHIIILIASIATFISCFAFLQSLDKTISVAQLSKDITAGSTISKDDIIFVDVAWDETIEDYLLTDQKFSSREVVASTDLSRSDLLNQSNTIRKATQQGLQSMSIGIETDNANGGDIRKNDVIDVWRTGDDSRLVVSQVSVRSIVEPDKRLGVSTSKTITLVLAVTPEQAQALSKIVSTKNVMVVLSNGTKTVGANESVPEPDSSGFIPLELSNENATGQ